MLASSLSTISAVVLVCIYHSCSVAPSPSPSQLTDLLTGVAADLSHINTNSTVTGYDPTPSGLKEALSDAEIVLIPAGVPRKPGMTRDGMPNLSNLVRSQLIFQISSTPTLPSFVTLPRRPLMLLPTPRSSSSPTLYVESDTIIETNG